MSDDNQMKFVLELDLRNDDWFDIGSLVLELSSLKDQAMGLGRIGKAELQNVPSTVALD